MEQDTPNPSRLPEGEGDSAVRLAMWSGPRNVSTAMMRAWGSRADTYVCDEPLYAHYLQVTGREHPGREEILAACETDWRKVVAWLTGPIPEGKRIFFQKHMAHHLSASMGRDWLDELTHAFLIRDPAAMLRSLAKFLPEPTLEDTGLPQQVEIFDRVRRRTGCVPPVLDARDVLDRPEPVLRRLCAALGVPFDPAMLAWQPGPRPTDGVWGRWWYAEVYRSTGFRPFRHDPGPLPGPLRDLHCRCLEYYEYLHRHRLRPD